MKPKPAVTWIAVLTLCLQPRALRAAPAAYFAIHVVDEQTGRAVPLVQLQTTGKVRYYTDSDGNVAFDEPGLMDRDVWFGVASWGYEGPAAPFGNRGVTLRTVPGASAEVKVHRVNIAQRLYRLTGQGIYRDTVLLGQTPPMGGGLLNAGVTGQDTVETAVYQGKMFWFWGDTDRAAFPLGNFDVTGATSADPADLDPDRGIAFTYFTDPAHKGFVKPMVVLRKPDPAPVWIDGLMVLPDAAGRSRMLARYAYVDARMVPVEQGLVLYDDAREQFEPLVSFPVKSRLRAGDHPMRVRVGDQPYFYFPTPYAAVRVKDRYADVTDPAAYEGYTCLKAGAAPSKHDPALDRDASGKLVWTWRRGAEPVGPREVDEWVASKAVRRDETPFQMRDVATGKSIRAAGGSVAWNAYRKRWTMLFGQAGGTSNLGEVWYAEAGSTVGPWRDAVKVATHAMPGDNNDFYNPMQHPELAREGGRFVYFEGTFVTTFSGNPAPTPRYNYNQLMYRLDLSDARLHLPDPPAGWGDEQPVLPGP